MTQETSRFDMPRPQPPGTTQSVDLASRPDWVRYQLEWIRELAVELGAWHRDDDECDEIRAEALTLYDKRHGFEGGWRARSNHEQDGLELDLADLTEHAADSLARLRQAADGEKRWAVVLEIARGFRHGRRDPNVGCVLAALLGLLAAGHEEWPLARRAVAEPVSPVVDQAAFADSIAGVIETADLLEDPCCIGTNEGDPDGEDDDNPFLGRAR